MYKSDLTVTNHSLIKTFMDGEGSRGIMGADLYFFDEAHHLMGYSTSPSYPQYLQRPVRLIYAPLPEFYKDLIKARDCFVKRLSLLFDKFFCHLSRPSYGPAIAVLREMRRVIKERYENISRVQDEDVKQILKEELYKVAEQYNTARLIYNGSVEGRDVVVTPETAGIRNLPESPRSFTGDMKRANTNLKSCLFLSSTLTTDGNFSAFRAKTGSDFREGPVIPSTLPWHRAILWVPKSLPSPREDERRFARLFASFCSRYVPPFVKKDLGGVLILCTSLERMRACANALRASLDGALLVQGELPKRETMRRFLSSRSPVLVSSSSFREGFDAPGKKLTWVIMDRLPFASPEDEETNTTAKLLREWGLLKNPFDHGLDMMKLALRQSIGRLIRSPKDYGAITVLDSRTLSGKWNIDSAIPVPKENVVSDFLAPDDWIRLFQRKLLLF